MDADCPCAVSKTEAAIGAKYNAALAAGRERVAERRREEMEGRDWRAARAASDQFFALGRRLAQAQPYYDELLAIPEWAGNRQERERELEAVLGVILNPAPA